jgi:benzoyl-CoA reductase/2-hydroxyglutaryl-CoA dehydratase subunit BcrC/BadD/HgdB
MKAELLEKHLQDRPMQLSEARKKGTKIIGYFPGSFVPEEIIYASGAVPICLIHGGNAQAADSGLSVVPQVICPFARAQIGERLLKINPYYNMIDMLVAPITCQHLKKVAEVWECWGDLKIIKLGIPQQYGNPFEVAYYADRLRVLKDRLQKFTGYEVTDQRLGKAIDLYNRMRGLLKKISCLRQTDPSPISTLDFVKLNHASFYADPGFMVEVLDSVYQELKHKKLARKTDAPRILMVGPNIGDEDYSVLELVQEADGEIVIEEIFEGIRYYWNEVENSGDLYQSLTKAYLTERLPSAFMRNSAKKRLDFILKLIKDFKVSGVIWYQLLCCETYDSESYYFASRLGELNIPMLILESDYVTSSTGQLKTRIGAFIEILKSRY